MSHELERILNAPASDIMDAILRGFRTQVDVKGKLAELYLFNYLNELERSGVVQELDWLDTDGMPDFTIVYNSKLLYIECKNLRNETYKRPKPANKVEIQKTRNSKDGTNTRSYPTDYFDILSVCTFNQTGKWEFFFIKSSDLDVVEDNPSLLKIMQRVPIEPDDKWIKDLLEILSKFDETSR